jgi:hypothetical protein
MDDIQNPNPTIFKVKKIDEEQIRKRKIEEINSEINDEIDSQESIYILI